MSHRNTVAAVIVVYKPDFFSLKRLLQILQSQVSLVYLVNNDLDAEKCLSEFSTEKGADTVVVIDMGRNAGMAAALNRGISEAHNAGHSACWTFDQDSLPGQYDAAELYRIWSSPEWRGHKIAAVVPSVSNVNRGDMLPFLVFDRQGRVNEQCLDDEAQVAAAITSGMLISTRTWLEIGGMREAYFIDLVDTEWCFRAGSMGYSIIHNPKAQLQHSLGKKSRASKVLGIALFPQRAPLRTFYMVRNALLLAKESYAPVNWKVYIAPRLIKTCILALVFGPQRWAQIKAILKGIWSAAAQRVD